MLDILLVVTALGVVAILAATNLRPRRPGPERGQAYFDTEFLKITGAWQSPGAIATAVERFGGSMGTLSAVEPGVDPGEVRLRSPYGVMNLRLPRTGDAGKLLAIQQHLATSEGSYLLAALPEGTSLVVSTPDLRVSVMAEILP
jgi:hypothetical protein